MNLTITISYAVYVITIALQLSAGIILLIGNTQTDKESIVYKYGTFHRAIYVKEDGTLENDSELKEVAYTVWMNKLAFIFLIVGYLFNVFAYDEGNNKGISFFIIALLSLIIVLGANKFAKIKASKYGNVNIREYKFPHGTRISMEHKK